jgi:hypothetical protein
MGFQGFDLIRHVFLRNAPAKTCLWQEKNGMEQTVTRVTQTNRGSRCNSNRGKYEPKTQGKNEKSHQHDHNASIMGFIHRNRASLVINVLDTEHNSRP